MFAARRVITPLASRPMTYRLPSQLARRSFADESKPTKPAEGKSMQNKYVSKSSLSRISGPYTDGCCSVVRLYQ